MLLSIIDPTFTKNKNFNGIPSLLQKPVVAITHLLHTHTGNKTNRNDSRVRHGCSPTFHFLDKRSNDMTLISTIPPPSKAELGSIEHENERCHFKFVDQLLDYHWQGKSVHAIYDNKDEDGETRGIELTYGELTPLGARQLFHHLGVGIQRSKSLDNGREEKESNGVVFYDLGSGTGRLVVQLYLDNNYFTNQNNVYVAMKSDSVALKNIVGIEICNTRHQIALDSWEAVKASLVTNSVTQEETSSQQEKNNVIKFINQDILKANFSDATHLFIASLCFPPEVIFELSKIILANVSKNIHSNHSKGRLKVVAALSDLPLFEQKKEVKHWIKTTQIIQTTWGESLVRIYKFIT